MKFVLISGSHRINSESSRVAKFLKREIEQNLPNTSSEIIDLAGNPLPLWDDSFWSNDAKWEKLWTPTSKILASADALIVISPEWSGMAAPALKNFFLFCKPEEVGHKPALIVTVSSARGGAYPVNELRISSYKNTRICYIPEHLIIRDVNSMMKDNPATNDDDIYIRNRSRYVLRLLYEYASAFSKIREKAEFNYKDFPNGM